MRIAVFIKNTTHHQSYGGFETQNKILCEGLSARGHEVIVFSPKKELTTEKIRENGVEYVFIDCIFKKFNLLYEKSDKSWQNRSYKTFTQFHNQSKFDVIISQSSWGLGVIKRKDVHKVPVVSVSHGSKIGEYKTRIQSAVSIKDYIRIAIDIPHVLYAFFVTQRRFLHGSDNVVAVSSSVKKQIVSEAFLPEQKVVVIHNGIHPPSINLNLQKNSNNVEILYVGRILREKGLFALVDVLEKLISLDLEVNLNLVGEGNDTEALKKYVSDKSLIKYINLEGKLSYTDVINRMAQADIFVLPSLRVEGFPMTIVEAMFAGLPVVASDIGGNADAVVDGDTGYLVEPGNVDSLTEKLEQLVKNKDERLRMGKNAQNKAQSEFTQDIMIDKYLSVLTGVMK